MQYEERDISPIVRFFADSSLRAREGLSARAYAEAREGIPAWCIDALPCGYDKSGSPVVLLLRRSTAEPESGPFRGEPWVVGGLWDMVTPWTEFIREKARQELFGGSFEGDLAVEGPIDNQLFGTGWGKNTDGPYDRQGVTLQYCYKLIVSDPVTPDLFALDLSRHSEVLVIHANRDVASLHPYIREVIERSGWLCLPSSRES